jgi:hypothetical protein
VHGAYTLVGGDELLQAVLEGGTQDLAVLRLRRQGPGASAECQKNQERDRGS